MASPLENRVIINRETEMESGEETNTEIIELVNRDTSTSGTVTETENQSNAEGREIITFDNLVEKYTDEAVMKIAYAGPQNSELRVLIVNFTMISAADFLKNVELYFSTEELKSFTDMVSKLSSKYRDNPELVQQIDDWCKSRKNMIKLANSVANELDQNLITIYIARLISSSIDILDSLNLGIYHQLCSGIASYVSNYSIVWGLITESVLQQAPNLRYMGIVSSFFENLRSELSINQVTEAMKKDREMFEPLKRWFDETDEFKDSVKQLLPYEIDKKDIENIEKALKDFREEQKIFAAAFMSNIRKDPKLYRDGKFLSKCFLFCRSDAAKEWYKRMVKGNRPSDQESALVYFRNELQQLERINLDSGSTIEIGKFSLQVSTLPRLIICGMNGISVYHCLKKIRSGSKHRYSDGLRQLAINAQSFFDSMDKIRFRYQYFD